MVACGDDGSTEPRPSLDGGGTNSTPDGDQSSVSSTDTDGLESGSEEGSGTRTSDAGDETTAGSTDEAATFDVPIQRPDGTESAQSSSPDSGLVDLPPVETHAADSTSDDASLVTDVSFAPTSASTDLGASGSSTPSATSAEESSAPADARLGCAGDLTATQTVNGNLSGNVSWSGVVAIMANTVLQNNAQLTIAPGTRIVVASDVYVELGNVATNPTVYAEGTEQEPIVFCGAQPDAGHWRGLRFGPNVTTNSEVHHVRVFDAGSTLPAVDIGSALLIENLEVYNSANVGVRAATFGPGSTELSVYDSASAVTLTEPAAVTRFPLGGQFTDNTENLARVTFTRVEEPTTYHDVGIPYLQVSNTEVMSQATVTYEAGVEYRFAADTTLTIGAFANVATWIVDGTEEAPVTFRGASATAGFWGGVLVGTNVSSDSVVDHLRLLHGGGTDHYALSVDAPVTISHLELADNEAGAAVGEAGLSETSTAWTVSNNAGEPLTVHPNALTRIPSGTYTGNGADRIIVLTGTNSSEGSVRDHGLPYYVEAPWDTRAGSDLTFEANTHFLMGPDTRITFAAFNSAAAVTFAGTAGAPVRFSAAQADFPGYWAGLIIGTAVLTGSSMTWTEIAGAGGPAADAFALRIDKAAFPVTNSSFLDFDTYGILVNNTTNTTNYEDAGLNNTFAGAANYTANVGY